MTKKGKSLMVVAAWAIGLLFVFCCSNIIVDVVVLIAMFASNIIIKLYAPEVHDEIFRPN